MAMSEIDAGGPAGGVTEGKPAPRTRASSVSTTANVVFHALLVGAALVTLSTIHMIAYKAPIEASMGIVQKIFYFHVPAAYSMYVGAGACFIGSAGYLWKG